MGHKAVWMGVYIAVALSVYSNVVHSVPNQNLKVYIQNAINTNPEVQASWHSFKSALYDIDLAKSTYTPKVDLIGRSEYVDSNSSADSEYASHVAEVSFSQMLYDGFRTQTEVERFEKIQLVRYFELLDTVESIALQTSIAYLDVMQQRELLLIAEDNLKSHVEVFKQLEEGVIAGVTRRADLEQISGRLSLSESNVITEQSNLHDVTSRFVRLTGMFPAHQLQLPESPKLTGLLNFEDFLFSAYTTNPALKATIYNIDAQKLNTKSARSSFHPKVDLIASYGTQSRDERGFNNTLTEAKVGLQLSFNLFNGGADSARISSSLEGLNLAKDLRDQSCRNVRQTIQISHNEINNLERQLLSLNEHRLSSDRVKTAYASQFKIGQRTLLDLLDSENEFYESSRAYIIATYLLKKGYFNLIYGVGRLTESLGLKKQGLADISPTESTTSYDEKFICPPQPLDNLPVIDSILERDLDNDGVVDLWDDCPDSINGENVNDLGCAVTEDELDNLFLDDFEDLEAQPTPVDTLAEESPSPLEDPLLDDDNVALENLKVLDSFTLHIPFTNDSNQISEQYQAQIDSVLKVLNSQVNARIIIHGHASLEGNKKYNQTLSEQRAATAASVISQHGNIDMSRIKTVGFGESSPLVDAQNETANATNRRIEVFVVTPKE